MRLRFFALILLLVVVSSGVCASKPLDIQPYLALRKKVISSIAYETLKKDPKSYIGQVFELRGSVSGILKNGGGNCIVIASNIVNVDTPPVDNPGADLACLVKIGPGCEYSLSDLQMVACTYNADIKRVEEDAKRAAEAAAAEKAARVKAALAKTAQQVIQKPEISKPSGKSVSLDAEDMVSIYKKAIKGFNRKLSDTQTDTIARSVLGFSYRYKIDPRLVCAVILAESHFKIGATSSAGAQGLGQLMPSTAAGLGVNNAYDPVENVYGSVRYIKGMLDRMSGNKKWNDLTWYDLGLAIAAYNAGPGAVKKHGGIPPYKETQAYVRRVTSIYKQLCGVK